MTILVVEAEQGSREVDLGESLTIGRRPENKLMLTDAAASGRHALITLERGVYYIEDLNSSNGTLVNGVKITRQKLNHGDVIMIGRQRLEFVDGSELLGALITMAPPPQQKPPPRLIPPDDGLPKFIIGPGPHSATLGQETPPTRPLPMTPAPPSSRSPAAAGSKPGAADVDLLDQLVDSIRVQRDREKIEREQKQAQIQLAWELVLKYAEQMKLKVGTDPRVKYFGISRVANDIMIRFQRDPKLPLQFLMMSLHHPDQKNQPLAGIWMRRTGEQDRCFPNAETAASELVSELSFLL